MSEGDNLHAVWSEEELDGALATLHADVRTDEGELARARATLMRGAGIPVTAEDSGTRAVENSDAAGKPARHWARWLAAAAAVVLLVAGAVVVRNVVLGNPTAAPPVANSQQNPTGIEGVGAKDAPIPPGQYRYFATHAWHGRYSDPVVVLEEVMTEVWMPADPEQEWLQRTTNTGKVKMLAGTEQEARAAGLLPGPQPPEDKRAPRGEFHGPIQGSWQTPTPEFLKSLPTDPRQLYDRLRADTDGRGQDPDKEMLVYVADAIRGGTVPANVRLNLYRALELVPGLSVAPSTTLDGRTGLSLSFDKAGEKQELIIDPATGEPIGERQTATGDDRGVPRGTVSSETSIETGIAPRLGVKPGS
ncbi:CU044_5270 family protein [Amycolatopsis anabasis]|uniref:CU044_5270 family protein n=1 Tax=Amycolatopsis anabasis TaxID=1840409 RepID=UPI00131D88C4|nr:CU044_5270 family protein [Amycolatopsis anabasis]